MEEPLEQQLSNITNNVLSVFSEVRRTEGIEQARIVFNSGLKLFMSFSLKAPSFFSPSALSSSSHPLLTFFFKAIDTELYQNESIKTATSLFELGEQTIFHYNNALFVVRHASHLWSNVNDLNGARMVYETYLGRRRESTNETLDESQASRVPYVTNEREVIEVWNSYLSMEKQLGSIDRIRVLEQRIAASVGGIVPLTDQEKKQISINNNDSQLSVSSTALSYNMSSSVADSQSPESASASNASISLHSTLLTESDSSFSSSHFSTALSLGQRIAQRYSYSGLSCCTPAEWRSLAAPVDLLRTYQEIRRSRFL